MKDKEMIEEMFEDVAKVMCDCEDKEKFFRPHRYGCRNCYMHTVIQHIVFFLRNSDYEKLPKDSVVLSKEEINNAEYFYVKDGELILVEKGRGKFITNEWYKELLMKMPLAHELAKERKEMAEKFAKAICEKFGYDKLTHEDDEDIDIYLTASELFELAKQLGVEIKE